jgi:hypothetical protein
MAVLSGLSGWTIRMYYYIMTFGPRTKIMGMWQSTTSMKIFVESIGRYFSRCQKGNAKQLLTPKKKHSKKKHSLLELLKSW